MLLNSESFLEDGFGEFWIYVVTLIFEMSRKFTSQTVPGNGKRQVSRPAILIKQTSYAPPMRGESDK